MITDSPIKNTKKKVGVVADDITGANDIGVMFLRGGYKSGVFSFREDMTKLPEMSKNLDVVILDTDSRLDEPETAARKVKKATAVLKTLNCDLYHNKTCSVFRGNIGAEFDAMQDELGVSCSFVVLGFPRNKRTTINGIHYVDNVILTETAFKNDPIHPTKEANLIKILSSQTKRKVGAIFSDWLDKPLEEIKSHIEQLRKEYNYIIFDVRNQKDLSLIAELLKDEKNICGSSAIGEELPVKWGANPDEIKLPKFDVSDETGSLIMAGSLTNQTKEQVAFLRGKDIPNFEFNSLCVFDQNEREKLIKEISKNAATHINAGEDVVVFTSQDDQTIEKTRKKGKSLNLSREQIGKLISSSMYEIVHNIHDLTGVRKLVIAGGDTSAAIMNGLNIHNMIILNEIEAGVPSMYGFQGYVPWLLVLKSGSFGSTEFLLKAVKTLDNLQNENITNK